MTHFGLKRYLTLWEMLGEYPYYCTIGVLFLRGLGESKWKSKNAKFGKLETLVFNIIKIQV